MKKIIFLIVFAMFILGSFLNNGLAQENKTAKETKESSEALIRKGYVPMGRVRVNMKVVDLQGVDTIERALKEAGSKGGDFVLFSEKRYSYTDEVTKNVCAEWVKEVQYVSDFDPDGTYYPNVRVDVPVCAQYRTKTISSDRMERSAGDIWRYDPKKAALMEQDIDLKLAVNKGNKQEIQTLIGRGANVDVALPGAVAKGDVSSAEMLLKAGAKVKGMMEIAVSDDRAAAAGDTGMIELLLTYGSDPNEKDGEGKYAMAPIQKAAKIGFNKAVKVLIDAGANANIKDSYGNTLIHDAAKVLNVELTKLLLEKGIDPDKKNKDSDTPLIIAGGSAPIVELLLQAGANPKAKNKLGFTSLHVAIQFGNGKAAKLLLEKGANPNAKLKDGLTPLHSAAFKNHLDIVGILLTYGAKVNVQDKYKYTPLSSAVEGHGGPKMIRLLLDSGADPKLGLPLRMHASEFYKPKRKSNVGLLYLAASHGDPEVVAEILKMDLGEKIAGTPDKKWASPLHIAADQGHADVVALLLKQEGVDPNATDYMGYSLLYGAVEQRNVEVVKALLENGADPNQDPSVITALQYFGKPEGYNEIVDLLIAAGFEVNGENYGIRLLNNASHRGNMYVVKLLLDKGADPGKDSKGYTAISGAAQMGNLEIVKLLIKKGADVNGVRKENRKDNFRTTPLEMASMNGHLDVVKLLLKHGADPNVESMFGKTALMLAEEGSHKEIVSLLKKAGAK